MTKVVLPLKVLWCGKCFPSQCFPDMTLLIDPSVSTDTRSPRLCMAALPLNYFPLLPIQISESELIWEQQPEEEQTCQSSVVGLKNVSSSCENDQSARGWLGRNQTCRLQSDQAGNFPALHFIWTAKRATMSKCDVALALTGECVGEPPRTSSKYTTIITTTYLHFSAVQFLVLWILLFSSKVFQYLLTILKKSYSA